MKSLAATQKRKPRGQKASGKRLSSTLPRGIGSVEELEKRLRSEFDLETKYGPVVGLTRLERWERAVRLGLEPPVWVRDAITQHGTGHDVNAHVFTSGKV